MLRDNLVGLIEPMRIQKQASNDSSSFLENPRLAGAESSLTENVTSPFQTEPAHICLVMCFSAIALKDSVEAGELW